MPTQRPEDTTGDDLATFVLTTLKALSATCRGLGSLVTAYSEFTTRRRMRNIEEAIEKIAKLLKPEYQFNAFKAKPEAMQLLDRVLRLLQFENSEKKRERYANLIVASWIADEPVKGIFDEAMLFAKANDSFTDSHLAVLQHLYEQKKNVVVSFNDLADQVCANSARERSQIATLVLSDLCSDFVFVHRAVGLNDPDHKIRLLVTTNLSPEGIARDCNHEIIARGRRYIDWVLKGPKALAEAANTS